MIYNIQLLKDDLTSKDVEYDSEGLRLFIIKVTVENWPLLIVFTLLFS